MGLSPVACVVVSLLVVLLFREMILQRQQLLGLGLVPLGTFPEDIKSTSLKKKKSNSPEIFGLRGVENDELETKQ